MPWGWKPPKGGKEVREKSLLLEGISKTPGQLWTAYLQASRYDGKIHLLKPLFFFSFFSYKFLNLLLCGAWVHGFYYIIFFMLKCLIIKVILKFKEVTENGHSLSTLWNWLKGINGCIKMIPLFLNKLFYAESDSLSKFGAGEKENQSGVVFSSAVSEHFFYGPEH